MYLIPTILLMACGRTYEQSYDDKDTLISSALDTKSNSFVNAENICFFIDSVYSNHRQTLTHTFPHLQDVHGTDTTDQFVRTLGQHIKSHFRCNSFDIFVFVNSETSSTHFSELIKLSDPDRYTEYPERMYDIFPKGGSTIILFKEIIVRHIRACNFDEAIEGPKESLLLNFLYGEMKPDGKYFLRIKCGGSVEIK